MIKVTRLNGNSFVVNAELIETVDQSPDTIVTLQGGRKFVVRESLEEIILRAIDYRSRCRFLPPEGEA